MLWVRKQISSKPDTYTEAAAVDAAGISVKVTRITVGGLTFCQQWLPLPRGRGMGCQKSAEAIVGCSPSTEGLDMWSRLKARTSQAIKSQQTGQNSPPGYPEGVGSTGAVPCSGD